jgi:putative spermidine/putrescine transport system permease protein
MSTTTRRRREANIPLLIWIGAILALIVLLLPVAVVVLAGLNSGDFLSFPPQGLSLRWVWAFLSSDTYMSAYLFSLGLAALTMVVSTTIGTMAALFLTRSQSRWTAPLRSFFMAPIVLPGVVLGLALYVFYVTTNFGLARSLPGMLIGHVLVTCPFVIGTVTASLVGFDRSLEEAARSLGAGPWTAFRKVTLRLIAPGVTAGAIFAFIISFGQFEIALFLSTPNIQPLPMAMYISLRYAFEPIAAAAGIFAIVLVVVSMVITAGLVDLRRLGAPAKK